MKKFEAECKAFIEVEAENEHEAYRIIREKFGNRCYPDVLEEIGKDPETGITHTVKSHFVDGICECCGKPIFEGDGYYEDEDGIMVLKSCYDDTEKQSK